MFFILSKLLLFLLMPFWWIVLLFVWMMFSKSQQRKKRLRIAILIIAVVFTSPFIYRSLVLLWQPKPVEIEAGKKYEMGILLGGMAMYDKHDRGYFGPAADRFIQATNLYHRGIIRTIIVSGGTGKLLQDGPAEALFLRQEFIRNGVPDSAIIIESQSRNTYENAIYSKKITDSLRIQPPFVLITSALHMPRSIQVFKKAGYTVVPYPCDYLATPQHFSFGTHIMPSSKVLSAWEEFIKEIVGVVVYKLSGKA